MFSTYSNEDYDRRNEDVDPMAASAEYELEKRVERLELFPVELEKGEKPGAGARPQGRRGRWWWSPLWRQLCPGPPSVPPAKRLQQPPPPLPWACRTLCSFGCQVPRATR